jgi:aminopeptidase
LADAIYHATSFRPKIILDVATLTGAVDVALGRHYIGAFCSSTAIWNQILKAAQFTGDGAWRLPLDPRYLSQMESTVADLKNSGDRGAGACTAAAFLSQFVASSSVAVAARADGLLPFQHTSDLPTFVHLDIAGAMHYPSHESGYNCKGMSGRPTRLLLSLLQDLSSPYKSKASL